MLNVMDEFETIQAALFGHNLSRFGDGELRLARGGKAISQKADSNLANELRKILAGKTAVICCVPPIYPPAKKRNHPRMKFWSKYQAPEYMMLYGPQLYGSSFVTRPDSAPWIDTPDYWDRVAALWRGKDILYVTGGDSHLPTIMRDEASYLSMFRCEKRDAYSQVDEIVEECRIWQGTVLLAAGATGTVVAHRLASIGVHAVDIGHMGMFYTVKGAYEMDLDQLATPYYRDQLATAHKVKKWGTGGYSHVPASVEFAKKIGAASVLDYGCGRGTFKKTVEGMDPRPFKSVIEYDPGVPGKDIIPKPADLVVCTDVLEHVEPDLLDNVLKHIYAVGRKGAYLVIARKASNKVLPDGRNSHLIQAGMDFWGPKVEAMGYSKVKLEDGRKHILAWCSK